MLQKKVENQNKKIIDLERKVKELEDQNKKIVIDLRDSLKKEIYVVYFNFWKYEIFYVLIIFLTFLKIY